jgi:hypothetical protein
LTLDADGETRDATTAGDLAEPEVSLRVVVEGEWTVRRELAQDSAFGGMDALPRLMLTESVRTQPGGVSVRLCALVSVSVRLCFGVEGSFFFRRYFHFLLPPDEARKMLD